MVVIPNPASAQPVSADLTCLCDYTVKLARCKLTTCYTVVSVRRIDSLPFDLDVL